jgi:hypothetical protein
MQFVHVGFESQFSDSDFAVGILGQAPSPSYDPIYPPPLHTIYVYTVYLYTVDSAGGVGGGGLEPKTTRAIV